MDAIRVSLESMRLKFETSLLMIVNLRVVKQISRVGFILSSNHWLTLKGFRGKEGVVRVVSLKASGVVPCSFLQTVRDFKRIIFIFFRKEVVRFVSSEHPIVSLQNRLFFFVLDLEQIKSVAGLLLSVIL
jgi:hypothetical protein